MPLRVLIVGLSVPITLARNDHEVHIYEKSSFTCEIGAALQIGPQSHKILVEDLGVDTDKMEPTFCSQWRYMEDLDIGGKPSRVSLSYEILHCLIPMSRFTFRPLSPRSTLKYLQSRLKMAL